VEVDTAADLTGLHHIARGPRQLGVRIAGARFAFAVGADGYSLVANGAGMCATWRSTYDTMSSPSR
jgi:hypothetical protein